MLKFTGIFFVLFIGASVSAVEYSPTVDLAAGKVRGLVIDVEDYGKVDAYVGIRYVRAFFF